MVRRRNRDSIIGMATKLHLTSKYRKEKVFSAAEEELKVEENTEKYDDVERIIAEAEEAAFQITEITEETEAKEEKPALQ